MKSERALYEYLQKVKTCKFSNARIGAVLGFSARTVSRHLALLEQRRLIEIVRHSPNSAGPGSDPVGRTISVKSIPETRQISEF